MGTGYTIDTPIRVAHYGISSVISIIDHRLTEQMREYYSNKYDLEFTAIPESEEDSRAKRITAYLNLVQKVVHTKFEALRNSSFEPGTEITKYFDMLSNDSVLHNQYVRMLTYSGERRIIAEEDLRKLIHPGSIDVNIMTKIDGANKSSSGEDLPVEFNDAHAALRGFANSDLASSVVFSAGLNPRLYGYISEFADFFPNELGIIKKKVVLKVSDYRSALIQGKFLAKKGIWVSEFRIESGLNCGGHAFATDGFLLGPILNEFKENKSSLISTQYGIYTDALVAMNKPLPEHEPEVLITVQGGVGDSTEQDFLLKTQGVDSIGWGSPFLLVPEAVSIDSQSLHLLSHAKEDDYYLSEVSPLGVSFNTVKGNTADIERLDRIANGKPGAPCVKKHLAFNTDYTEDPICTASLKFQKKSIDDLMAKNLSENDFKRAFEKITEKMCLCVGLGNPSQIEKGMSLNKGTIGSAICPGPNTAYFSKIVTLKEMIDHIYGKTNIISFKNRPNMFIKELQLYISYLKRTISDSVFDASVKQDRYILKFISNLNDGINYYEVMFEEMKEHLKDVSDRALSELSEIKSELEKLVPVTV